MEVLLILVNTTKCLFVDTVQYFQAVLTQFDELFEGNKWYIIYLVIFILVPCQRIKAIYSHTLIYTPT